MSFIWNIRPRGKESLSFTEGKGKERVSKRVNKKVKDIQSALSIRWIGGHRNMRYGVENGGVHD